MITGGSAAAFCSEHISALDSDSDLDSDWIGLRTHLSAVAVKCPHIVGKTLQVFLYPQFEALRYLLQLLQIFEHLIQISFFILGNNTILCDIQ